MKKYLIPWITLLILSLSSPCLGEAPHQMGPFVLNQNIEDVTDYVRMETALPIRHMESIEEVEIKDIKGFKSGLIAYGTCAVPNRILRIKLKYEDSSKSFYESLKKRFDARFGDCDDYRGDPFHIVIGWKWSFTDKDSNKISLTLQHNTMDTEEKMGNTVKLTLTNLMSKELACHKHNEQIERMKYGVNEKQIEVPDLTGWDLYVPR